MYLRNNIILVYRIEKAKMLIYDKHLLKRFCSDIIIYSIDLIYLYDFRPNLK